MHQEVAGCYPLLPILANLSSIFACLEPIAAPHQLQFPPPLPSLAPTFHHHLSRSPSSTLLPQITEAIFLLPSTTSAYYCHSPALRYRSSPLRSGCEPSPLQPATIGLSLIATHLFQPFPPPLLFHAAIFAIGLPFPQSSLARLSCVPHVPVLSSAASLFLTKKTR
ncbi:hypothetical protein AMTR_s00034p00068960 [Amborella trichopoda]|uniref:Uncharacterized protein n=1 Tax=Amborella trichopoda TaxID=13333 RepID=W1PWL9_AMBTC|nr:hypothetical protein AMTR_s00034p00068960 [Amborella trichopoda]